MKKLTLLTLFLGIIVASIAWKQADKFYRFDSGKIHFYSDAPLEKIEADTKEFVAIINPANRKFAFAVLISTFEFDKSLMQEHFNENYMESEKYPKATFSGTINEDIDLLKDSTYNVTVTGDLTIHGVKKARTLDAKVIVKNGMMDLSSKFKVKLEDHDIEIPKMVFKNIAEVIDVDIAAKLKYDK